MHPNYLHASHIKFALVMSFVKIFNTKQLDEIKEYEIGIVVSTLQLRVHDSKFLKRKIEKEDKSERYEVNFKFSPKAVSRVLEGFLKSGGYPRILAFIFMIC